VLPRPPASSGQRSAAHSSAADTHRSTVRGAAPGPSAACRSACACGRTRGARGGSAARPKRRGGAPESVDPPSAPRSEGMSKSPASAAMPSSAQAARAAAIASWSAACQGRGPSTPRSVHRSGSARPALCPACEARAPIVSSVGRSGSSRPHRRISARSTPRSKATLWPTTTRVSPARGVSSERTLSAIRSKAGARESRVSSSLWTRAVAGSTGTPGLTRACQGGSAGRPAVHSATATHAIRSSPPASAGAAGAAVAGAGPGRGRTSTARAGSSP
jgi:hypothetical protein